MTKNLDEIRLKNLFKKFFEKSIDFSKKSVIIIIVKREQEVPHKGLSDLFDNSVTNKFSKKFEILS